MFSRNQASRLIFVIFLPAVTLTASAVWARQDQIRTDFWGLAVRGYDPAAYFTDGRPVEGRSDFEYEWLGARWRFASAEHLEMFKADPEKYAPQYGGYCAWAVAQGAPPASTLRPGRSSTASYI